MRSRSLVVLTKRGCPAGCGIMQQSRATAMAFEGHARNYGESGRGVPAGQALGELGTHQVFAHGDKGHLRGDDALPGVMHLRDIGTDFGSARQRLPLHAKAGQRWIIESLTAEGTADPWQLLSVATLGDPGSAQRRQALDWRIGQRIAGMVGNRRTSSRGKFGNLLR